MTSRRLALERLYSMSLLWISSVAMLQVQIEQTVVQETPDADAAAPPGVSRSLILPKHKVCGSYACITTVCQSYECSQFQRLYPKKALWSNPRLENIGLCLQSASYHLL